MKKQTGSQQEKEYVKAVYYHPAYLTSMQSAPGEAQGQGSLVGCRPWGRTELDMTEVSQSAAAEYIMRNTGLDEAQAGIKIAGRNTNNLRYVGDTTLMAESAELKSLLMKVKEENENVGFKLNVQKTKIAASGPITSWQTDGETVEQALFWGAPKSLQMVIAAMKLKDAYSLEGKL